MKRLALILFAFFSLLACVAEPEEGLFMRRQIETDESGKKVTVEFTMPNNAPATRGLGEGGQLHNLRLAVFGSSGYLKEYVEAQPVADGLFTYQTYDADSNLVTHNVQNYRFSATISLSDSPRTIHVLGNGPDVMPFGYDTNVMPIQLTADGDMGYWQMISLPNGIKAKRDALGNYIDRHGDIIEDGFEYYPTDYPVEADRGKTRYVADDETEAAFDSIPMIRNWAKIVLGADNSAREHPGEEGYNESNFDPVSLAVVNVPSRGSLAPYYTKGFISNYQDCSFPYLEDTLKYTGNLPIGTVFDDSIPDKSYFEYFRDPAHKNDTTLYHGVAGSVKGSVYLYERPAPSAQIPPSYVIIYGYFTDPDATDTDPGLSGYYFYKVDLMETRKELVNGEWQWHSRYYPIFRNFKYQITVKKIMSAGHATPEAAAAAAGSADVSADVTTSHLADISDGVGRLHVTPWMAKTFTRVHDSSHPVDELSVLFSNTIGGTEIINMDSSAVSVSLLPPDDGSSDTLITNIKLSAPYDPSKYDNPDPKRRGWRNISFCTAAPGRVVRSQTLRITGTHSTGRLYRDVIISIQPIQPMRVVCNNPRIASTKGAKQSFTIKIPDGLGESMFPLTFTIEALNMTLSPDNTQENNNLPVTWGTSLADETEDPDYYNKQSFQFTKTISWSDYLKLVREIDDEDDSIWRCFTCYFVTNRDNSASKVWVYNEYFDKVSTSFVNFNYKYFKNLTFTTPIPKEEGVELPITFQLIQDPDVSYPESYPLVLLRPRGITIKRNAQNELPAGVTDGPDPGTYYYQHPNPGVNVSLTFVTQNSDADITLDLTALDYEPGHLEPHRFNIYYNDKHHLLSDMPDFINTYGILDGTSNSNAAYSMVNSAYQVYNNSYGDNKAVYFGYYDDPDALNVPVTLYDIGRKKLTESSNVSALKVTAISFPWTPDGPKSASGVNNYHEIELRTIKAKHDDPVYFILSAPGYMEEEYSAERFYGRVHTINKPTASWMNSNFKTATSSFSYYDGSDFGYCEFIFEPSDGAPAVIKDSSKGLILGQDGSGNAVGGTYRITVKTGARPGNDAGSYPQQTLLHINFKMPNANRPASVTPATGEYYLYPGSNDQYIWHFPTPGLQESYLDLVAEPGRVVYINSIIFKSYSSTPKI